MCLSVQDGGPHRSRIADGDRLNVRRDVYDELRGMASSPVLLVPSPRVWLAPRKDDSKSSARMHLTTSGDSGGLHIRFQASSAHRCQKPSAQMHAQRSFSARYIQSKCGTLQNVKSNDDTVSTFRVRYMLPGHDPRLCRGRREKKLRGKAVMIRSPKENIRGYRDIDFPRLAASIQLDGSLHQWLIVLPPQSLCLWIQRTLSNVLTSRVLEMFPLARGRVDVVYRIYRDVFR